MLDEIFELFERDKKKAARPSNREAVAPGPGLRDVR